LLTRNWSSHIFAFVTWTAVEAALFQGDAATRLRLEVQFLRWKINEDAPKRTDVPLSVPKDAKSEVSVELDAPIGKSPAQRNPERAPGPTHQTLPNY
jgi:hypothetical protein